MFHHRQWQQTMMVPLVAVVALVALIALIAVDVANALTVGTILVRGGVQLPRWPGGWGKAWWWLPWKKNP